MTILVTGAAGFIGSHTSAVLLKQGHQVVGLDNLNDYYNPDWKKQNLAPLQEHGSFTFYQQDICDLEGTREIFARHQIKTIVHLAARAGVRASIEQPFLYEETNVRGTLNLLEIARQKGIKQFVFASSSSVYGNQEKVPFSETDPCNQPISPYAATKKASEMLAHTYAHLYDINCIALRFFTVYGPAGRPDMAPYLFTEAILTGKPIKKFGDGNTRRDYTYIDDVVAGVVAAVGLDHRFEIINLGNNKPITLNEFIATLEEITDKTMKIEQHQLQPGDVEQTFADITKAQKLLGFNPSTRFKEGLAKFVSWYQENRL